MAIPTMHVFYYPVLMALAGGATNAKTALPYLTRHFGFTAEDLAEMLPSGPRGRVFDRADWSLFHLMKAGLVDRPQRGVYVVSALGRDFLAGPETVLDSKRLAMFPAYQAFLTGGAAPDPQTGNPSPPKPNPPLVEDRTPEEAMDAAQLTLQAALREELLAAVQGMTPRQFEQLIVDLLLAMGYGGGDQAMGERIGKSGDGGIDGIINEDALGLDAVYIQAKRYAPDSKVGRPALQAFVGSLTGEGANKGVFVTTSDYSREAREYLQRVQHRIVLINGERLAQLMIQHEVGVRARKTYVLRSVDEDYFSPANA